ncbi:MAG: hypothetical protein JWR76_70 [Mucilaginibacter sp.]|nr:hypothetical protein [Mucilaginibacter sp.]
MADTCALVGVVTNKSPCIPTLKVFTVLNIVGDNTNNGEEENTIFRTPMVTTPTRARNLLKYIFRR